MSRAKPPPAAGPRPPARSGLGERIAAEEAPEAVAHPRRGRAQARHRLVDAGQGDTRQGRARADASARRK